MKYLQYIFFKKNEIFFWFYLGLLSGRMLKAFEWRIIIFAGGLVAGTGLILSSLSSRLSYLILSYGFVTGKSIIYRIVPQHTCMPKVL